MKTVAEVLLLTATQNIAQRGHSVTEGYKGNFLAIMELIAKHDETNKRKMTKQCKATYTSHRIQNEILDCLAEIVRLSIIKEVKESESFSIMVDETKDVSKLVMSMVLRYYYRGAVHESLLYFEAAEHCCCSNRENHPEASVLWP